MALAAIEPEEGEAGGVQDSGEVEVKDGEAKTLEKDSWKNKPMVGTWCPYV